MNRPLKWGLDFLVGVFVGNLVWLDAFKSPAASFVTAGWWQVWAAAYCVAIIASLFGLGRLATSGERAAGSD